MFKTLKNAGLSALIAIGTLAAIPATAQADGLYLNFGGNNDARVGVYVGDNAPKWHRRDRRDDRWERRDDRWERRHNRRGCSAERALNKAERIGLRRARIVDIDRRTITVRGRKYGDRVTVTFAKARNCPIVSW
ncbi:MAG: hypothetical protein H0T56_05100 [Pseudaminobacter sp.]|nr:hypothetical protein [Pseudaminobacter sp.]